MTKIASNERCGVTWYDRARGGRCGAIFYDSHRCDIIRYDISQEQAFSYMILYDMVG